MKKQRLSTTTETLTSLSPCDSLLSSLLSTLSCDLFEEILCRLPLKSLIQFQCVCKSWKLLISNPRFAKKHLRITLTFRRDSRHHLIANPSAKHGYWVSPISSIFRAVSKSIITQTNIRFPPILYVGSFEVVGSCHGIICIPILHFVLFWNPSIKNFKMSPSLDDSCTSYGFGYDHYNDKYKVVAISCYGSRKTKVNVHTMGTNCCWRRIQEFPYGVPVGKSGKFVCGTINWVATRDGNEMNSPFFVVSLDLKNESYHEILQPGYGDVDVVCLTLGELRDSLCIFAHGKSFIDVWLMKEYGKKESWNKLFTIPLIEDHLGYYPCTKVAYIYGDEQVLLVSKDIFLVVYDSKSHTFKFPEIENINNGMVPTAYVESLITTCS